MNLTISKKLVLLATLGVALVGAVSWAGHAGITTVDEVVRVTVSD